MKGINDRLRVGMDVGNSASSTTSSSAAYPVLIQRDIWTAPDYGGTTTPPAGTRFCIIRGIGSGGGYDATWKDGGGQGGCFAKVGFFMTENQQLSWQVGQFNRVAGPASTQTQVYLNEGAFSSLKLLAAAGNPNSNSSPGQENQNGSVGDVVRSGKSATSQKGGDAGNDYSDLDSLNLGGTGASPLNLTTGYGGGSAVVQTGFQVAQYYPGQDGILVIEFWTGDPR